jgi:signal transduction histidine kinase
MNEMTSRQAFALARDFVPVTVVVVFASFVLWHEPRQSAELERSAGGRGSAMQSPAESHAGPRGLVEAIEPQRLAERPVPAPGLALLAGFGISAFAVLSSIGDRRDHGRETQAQMTGEMDRRAQALERAEREIERLRSSLEARVAERTLALERTVDELETMNAMVSHDLRSPLAAVIQFTAILAEDYEKVLDLPAKDYLNRIASSARAAVSLLDGLLAFSQSGREEMHRTSVDMRRLVEGVRDDLIGRVQPVRGSIEIADLPGAYADPAMIRRVYTNLISNALKFVRVGEAPRVEIGGDMDCGELVYFVRDRGIGFDMGSFDRLFNVFGRLHPGVFEGHGVGLSIVDRLVRRHGGRVWAQSSLGNGATFLFSLPLAPSGQRDLRAGDRAPAL